MLSLAFVEELYAKYLTEPESVPPEWRRHFEKQGDAGAFASDPRLGPSFQPPSIFNPGGDNGRALAQDLADAALQDRVDQMLRAFRVRGHLIARLDPLGFPRARHPELDPTYYGLTEADMDRRFSSRTIAGTSGTLTLREILERLHDTYCRSIGVQYMHIDDVRVKAWLQDRMERTRNRLTLTRDEQLRILTRLTDAAIFEEFIQKKYIGAKRFSLEGAESLVPLLDLAIEKAAQQGFESLVIGMAHRGRLNVLANIIGKSPRQIFREFEDVDPELYTGRGDVKYHLGHGGEWVASNGRTIHLSVEFNPSHLEFVNPVVLGRVRAMQDRAGDLSREKIMGILIHGDASITGEGIVQETLNLSELKAFGTGGTLNIIVNNQIGFTTAPEEARSSLYASAIAKMLQIPVFHVNGEDPEAVAQVVRLSLDFRAEFKRDVMIDMYCYRLHGHNEGDEPAFTHPVMYRAIRARKSVRESYLDHLLRLNEITREEADEIAFQRRKILERELDAARDPAYVQEQVPLGPAWRGYRGGSEDADDEEETGVDAGELASLLNSLATVPADFEPHPKLKRFLQHRREMAEGKRPVDWATAEALAFASLAVEGYRVRVCGQDTARGTFSQRHATLHDFRDGRPYVALQHLSREQAPVEVVNSPLSEVGVLGFEYGYSLETPDGLVAWEAQFGDFCNVAQVIIDQFIASGEDKWNRLSGLVLLLPHGFEGQGPEHSSARLERFLTLAAEDNIQVVSPSTPAQYFHALRRQVLRLWRKPLIVMTPKSLLRHPQVVSTLGELAEGGFARILTTAECDPSAPFSRVLVCTGKIYYELEAARRERKRDDVAIVRLEQLYPLADDAIERVLARCPVGAPIIWVQEEPENMGAWNYFRHRFSDALPERPPLLGVTREESASPATGSARSHELTQRLLIEEAFGDIPDEARMRVGPRGKRVNLRAGREGKR